jgi:hypothetical protein
MTREHLHQLHASLTHLEEVTRKLANQNFADIVKSARGKVQQLTEHPDLDKVVELHGDKAEIGHHDVPAANAVFPGA